jgi:hypothetical protein
VIIFSLGYCRLPAGKQHGNTCVYKGEFESSHTYSTAATIHQRTYQPRHEGNPSSTPHTLPSHRSAGEGLALHTPTRRATTSKKHTKKRRKRKNKNNTLPDSECEQNLRVVSIANGQTTQQQTSKNSETATTQHTQTHHRTSHPAFTQKATHAQQTDAYQIGFRQLKTVVSIGAATRIGRVDGG